MYLQLVYIYSLNVPVCSLLVFMYTFQVLVIVSFSLKLRLEIEVWKRLKRRIWKRKCFHELTAMDVLF